MNDFLSEDVEQTIRDLVFLTLPDDPNNPELNDERLELEREMLDAAREQLRDELVDQAADLEMAAEALSNEDIAAGPVALQGAVAALPAGLLLEQLSELTAQRSSIADRIALLVAYAREFVEEAPSLSLLAQATGMSISGVRTCYGDTQRAQVAARLRRPPLRGALAPVWRGETSPHGLLLGVDETGSWVALAVAQIPLLLIDAPPGDVGATELIAVLRAQASAAGWTLRETDEAALLAATETTAKASADTCAADRADAGRPGRPSAGAVEMLHSDAQTPLLLQITPTTTLARLTGEQCKAVAALLRAHPHTHLLWPTQRSEVHAVLTGPTGTGLPGAAVAVLRRPPRRHEQFWSLDAPDQPPQLVRPARPDRSPR